MHERPLKDTALTALDLNEAARPSIPPLPDFTPARADAGRTLKAIHLHHLRDMAQVQKLLEMIKAGQVAPSALPQQLQNMPLAENMALFGTLCGRECQVLTFHHNAEEQMMFPQLEAAQNQALDAVVQKLKDEHLVVHELLLRLEQAAQSLVAQPTNVHFECVAEIFAKLSVVVKSHFGYEETELEEALGLYAEIV